MLMHCMTRKHKKEDYDENLDPGNYKLQKRMTYGPFFKSMFTTFGYTLLVFMGFIFLMFLVLWLVKR